MSIATAVVTGTTPTSTGTQSFTSSGFGTPQAALVFISEANTTNNPEVNAGIGIGITDGTTHWAIAMEAVSALSTTKARRSHQNLVCTLINSITSVTRLAGAFSAWTTDGITIDFTTVDGSFAHDITVILINGCDNAYVGANVNTSGVNDITAVGFKPNLVFSLCDYAGAGTGTAFQSIVAFGAAHNNSSDVVTQGWVGFSSQHGQGTEVGTSMTDSGACIGVAHAGSEQFSSVAQDFDASGFSYNVTGGTGDNVYYLALDTGDTDGVSIDVVDSPTSTGTWNVEDPAFEPQLAILGLTAGTVDGTVATADPMNFGLSAFDGTTEACIAIDVDDAATTTDTQSNAASKAIQTYEYGGSSHDLMHEATFTSFDSLGYNLSFPTYVDGTARKWLSIAIEKEAVVGGLSITHQMIL